VLPDLDSPVAATTLRTFPLELCEEIYAAIFERDPDSANEPFLAALHGDQELYSEALTVFDKVKIVTIKIHNTMNIGSPYQPRTLPFNSSNAFV
jgi:hypothetical protein